MNREFIPKFSAMAVEQLERQQHVEFKTRWREDEDSNHVCCMHVAYFFEFNHVVLLIQDSKLETTVKTRQDKTRKKTFMIWNCKNMTGDAVH